ncbi:sulfonate transport system permease protein [Verrucomicrobium sp. GAS474]|uniref:ABC transporter permease n=1 Tax=Verrucomicrobium sp. GAS474 TaxID=1882831 RepID=UPI000879D334|nr:ABC transporter permease [Verrucomicrobium sp. GAS474]SDT97227.1 sulfonate transport system permease protein [Verrucomicrobium sp. GAS474]
MTAVAPSLRPFPASPPGKRGEERARVVRPPREERWRGLVVPALLLLGWEAAARSRLLDPSLFPSPEAVWAEGARLAASGELRDHLAATFSRVLSGFALGAAAATLLGSLAGFSRSLRAFLDPTLQAVRNVPSMAWVPLFLLWFGIAETGKLALIALGAFFPIYLNLMEGVRAVDRKLVEAGRTHGFSGLALLRSVHVPAALPAYLVGLRQGLALAWMFVVAAEIMGASRGLGFLLIDGETTGRPATLLASFLLFAACGKGTDALLARASTRLLRWQDTHSEKR